MVGDQDIFHMLRGRRGISGIDFPVEKWFLV
jgi:hypothetical protein